MNKFKKVGLTALAASLISVSANAEVTIAGGAGITFSGGGDMDNGMAVNFFYIMDDAAYSSSGIGIDMGDAGKFTFENGGQNTGLMSLKDKIPTAGAEQAYDDMSGDGNGLASMPNEGVLGWANTYDGITVSANFNKGGDSATGGETSTQAGSSHSVAISGTISDGLEAGIGYGDMSGSTTANDETQMTVYGKYAVGGVTMALQHTDIDKPAGTKDITSLGYGVTFAVNDNLSIGLSRLDVNYNTATKSDQESTGIGASYTAGSMAIKGSTSTTDSAAGASGTDDKHTEIVLSFAF